MRSIPVFVGVVALLVGLVGLLAPVSVSPELRTVKCGSAFSPDLPGTGARDAAPADAPTAGEAVIGVNYAELCRMELSDRGIAATTVVAGGVFILLVALGIGALQRRSAVGEGSAESAADTSDGRSDGR